MDKIELTIAEVARLTGKGAEELKKLLTNETGEAIPANEMATKIAALNAEKIKETVARATKDAYSKTERVLAQKYGVTDYDGLDDLVAKLPTTDGKNGANDEEIKALKDKLNEAQTRAKELNKALEAEKKGREYDKTRSEIVAKGKAVIESLNLALSSDPAKREKQIEVLLQAIDSKKWAKIGDKFVAVDDSGSPIKDKDYNDMELDGHLKGYALSIYDEAPQTNNQNPAKPNQPQNKPNSLIKFADAADYMNQARQAKAAGNQELVKQLEEAWLKQQGVKE